MMFRAFIGLTAAAVFCCGLTLDQAESGPDSSSHGATSTVIASPETTKNTMPASPVAVGHPTFVSPHASPIVIRGGHVFVVNTPSDTLDVIDAETQTILARVDVGIDPVSVTVRPDGKEVWVSNHVSDSVSVIDNDPASPTYLQVIATVQDFNATTKATRFDEPVGIAFASNDKAYVALSSENTIAVINVATRKIDKRLTITAQDPRAIVVRGDRLYVIPFESNNKTQLSGGSAESIDGDLVTFDAWNHSIANNNVLSLGHVVDIVKHPKVPDRDLYVFDTKTDELVETVDTLGTLLYGLTVDSKGNVFVAQTDARNDVNGRAGTKKHGLTELENRAFLNRITRVGLRGVSVGIENPNDSSTSKQAPSSGLRPPSPPNRGEGTDAAVSFIDLEPLPPEQPEPNMALATPFAIEISNDDSTLVVSAAGSDKLFMVDVATGKVLGRTDVGSVPRGIALEHADDGRVARAWVFNAVANTVSLVDVSNSSSPNLVETVTLADPTHPAVKRGRIAFETAVASTTGTYSCASCHPDGHTDQLLWVLKTPIVTGGDQIMPRSTMPVRGLRDTEPYHWDGIPGDPYGGNNSANIHGSDPANSSLDNPANPARHLIDGGLAATMSMVGDTATNDEGKAGQLSKSERDDMAVFLLSVPYPPAQRRAYTNVLSKNAEEGFRLFHVDGDLDPSKPVPNVCGDCHRMPFLVSTNTPGTGMDAPTWRGAYDRFLILPQGRLNIIDFDFYQRVADRGQPERDIWQFSWGGRRRFDPIWDMVLEGSTGFSGTFARQVTLNPATAKDNLTESLLDALELSASEGAIVLEGEGVLIDGATTQPVTLQFDATSKTGNYLRRDGSRDSFTRKDLVTLAAAGKFVGTFTGRQGHSADVDHPQPAIWTPGPIEQQSGRQEFPILYDGHSDMTISGRHVDEAAHVIIDGRRVFGSVYLETDETLKIDLQSLPSVGMHLLQIQNSNGLFSNDFIFHVTLNAEAAAELRRRTDEEHTDSRTLLATAISAGNLEAVGKLIENGAKLNARQPAGGATPLSNAALHGQLDIAELLIEHGAKIEGTNQDGNTPLHVAAFLCRREIVQLLLDRDASVATKNHRGETPFDVVSSPWSQPLADFYSGIANAVGLRLDLERIEQERPKVARLLRDHLEKTR